MHQTKKNIFNFCYTFILVGALLLNLSVRAQTVTTSPYSSYGLGEIYLPGLNYNTGLGYAGSALDSNFHINYLNPAGLSGLQYATFEGSVVSRQSFFHDAKNSGFKRNTTLDHVVLGLPVAKKTGVSFGLVPFSGLGVNSSDTVETDFGRLNFLSIDSGSLNKGFLAVGTGIGKFSFGAEGGYIFGNIQRTREVIILDDPNADNVSRIAYTKLSGVSFRGALKFKTIIRTGYKDTLPDSLETFRHKLSNKINGTRISFAATYEPGSILNGEATLSYETFQATSLGGRLNNVTIEHVPDIKGTFYTPQGGSFGIAIQKNKWTTVADFDYRQWSKFRTFESDTFIVNGERDFSGSDSLTDSWRVSLGVQLHPDLTSNSFFLQSRYRAGAYYRHLGLRINGVDIIEYGVTLGWGIPLRRAYAGGPIPSVELSVAAGERGSLENNLTRERFINARIGLTINDRWFVRRKFD